MRRSVAVRGFTLVELLVSLALAGLVVAGALQLHIHFNSNAERQREITEVQQNLRVAMAILERNVRSAASGIPRGELRSEYGAGGVQRFYGFQFSNSNTYDDPKTTFDTTIGDSDTDPDWFRIVAADNSVAYGGRLPAGGTGRALEINSTTGWSIGDVVVVSPSAQTPCVREVTGTASGTPPQLLLGASSTNGFNPGGADDTCVKGMPSPMALRRVPRRYTAFRIEPDAANGGRVPRLQMRTASFGTSATAAAWTTIAEHIEDMQVAVILASGQICGEVNADTDNPASCDFSQAAAVRITLVARSSQRIPGVTDQIVGGYEDRPGVKVSDGLIRRALTTVIHLRNVVL